MPDPTAMLPLRAQASDNVQRRSVMTQPMNPEKLAELAERVVLGHRVTGPQQAFLLSLPADGSWKITTEYELGSYGKNSLRGFGKSGLIDGEYRDPMRHRLTSEGVRVAASLRSLSGKRSSTDGEGAR